MPLDTIGYFILSSGAEIIAEELPSESREEYCLRNPLIVDDSADEEGIGLIQLEKFDRFNAKSTIQMPKIQVVVKTACNTKLKEHYTKSLKFNKRFKNNRKNAGIDAVIRSMDRMLKIPELTPEEVKDQRLLIMPTHSEVLQ